MWFIIAVIAHLLNAFAYLLDKFLLTRRLPHPGVPAFWVGSMSVFALLLLPFDPRLPETAAAWGLDLLGGFLFVWALVAFYWSLQVGDASRVVPIVGGSVPLFTALLSYVFLHERVGIAVWLAISVLTVGTVVVGWERGSKRSPASHTTSMLMAGLLFAASFVVMDAVFSTQGFVAGFAWSRLGSLAAAVLLLLHPPTRRALFPHSPRRRMSTAVLIAASQGGGALAFVLINYAISLKGATFVNAVQGIQYVFLFLLTIFLTRFFPRIIKESLHERVIVQKTVGILIIVLGISLLSLA